MVNKEELNERLERLQKGKEFSLMLQAFEAKMSYIYRDIKDTHDKLMEYNREFMLETDGAYELADGLRQANILLDSFLSQSLDVIMTLEKKNLQEKEETAE